LLSPGGGFVNPVYDRQTGRRGDAFFNRREEVFMKSLIRLMATLLVLLALSAFLGACGGGDGTPVPPAPTPSSNWDEMKWDEDNWG
jgi:hypothetical protein